MAQFRRVPHVIYATDTVTANARNFQIAVNALTNNLAYDFEVMEFSFEARDAQGTAVGNNLWRARVQDLGLNIDLTKNSTLILNLIRNDTRRWDISYDVSGGGKAGHVIRSGGGAVAIYIDDLSGANLVAHISIHGYLLVPVNA